MGKKNIIQIDVYGELQRRSLQYITTIKCFINVIPGKRITNTFQKNKPELSNKSLVNFNCNRDSRYSRAMLNFIQILITLTYFNNYE